MRWIVGFLAGTVVGGAAVGVCVWALTGDEPRGAVSDATTTADRADPPQIMQLEAELDLEQILREEVTDELERVKAELARVRGEHASVAAASTPAPPGLDEAVAREADQRAKQGWFDQARLEGLPFRPDEIDRIREQWEAYTLARLYEKDRNAREPKRPALQRMADWRAVDATALEELGERGYDAMLWAGHMPNRVVVREVIGDSPAARAGIQAGDQIIDYDDTRLWRPYELQNETKAGEPGERVMITLLRNGEERRVSVLRGPLGVQVVGHSEPPYRE